MEIKGRTAVEDQQQPPPSSPDTTLTKVFVGGLAWETQRDALRDHFQKFGDIVEAVIITDKLTGRSKGYGFVTFKEGEAAKKACEDAAPVINGRKANCNLAALGARRGVAGKVSPPATPAPISPYAGGAGCGGATNTAAARPPAAPIPWYFPAGAPASTATMSPFHQHYPAGVPPFYAPAYGYSPSYATSTNMGYRNKMSFGSDRSWMYNRLLPGRFGLTEEFLGGVEYFILVATNLPAFQFEGRFRCPCFKHKNQAYLTPDEVRADLYKRGFQPDYWCWTAHGEQNFDPQHTASSSYVSQYNEEQNDRYDDMIHDAIGPENIELPEETPNSEAQKLYDLLSASQRPLWEGCTNHSELSRGIYL